MAKPLDPIKQGPITETPARSFDNQENASDEPRPNPQITTPIPNVHNPNEGIYEPEYALKDFQCGPWLDPDNSVYG